MDDRTRKARLEALVAAYGLDVTRWPAADRALAPSAADLDALTGSREASALDHLLGEAAKRQPASEPDALIAAIIAKTRDGEAPDVVSLPAERKGPTTPRRQARSRYRAPAAAALMAASLAVGLFVGTLSTTQTTVAQIGTLAGLDLGTTAPAATFDDDFLAQDEEDIL